MVLVSSAVVRSLVKKEEVCPLAGWDGCVDYPEERGSPCLGLENCYSLALFVHALDPTLDALVAAVLIVGRAWVAVVQIAEKAYLQDSTRDGGLAEVVVMSD